MDYLKSILKLDFEAAPRPWLEIREILRVAGGDAKAEIQAGPIVIDRVSERKRIILQIRAIIIEHEVPATTESSVEEAVELVNDLNNASPLPEVSAIRHTAYFVEPFVLPFHELVAHIKSKCLQPNSLLEPATDIALVYDQHEGGDMKHVQFGPMDEAQLRTELLRWPPEQLPKTFVFVNATYETKESLDYSSDLLRSFLKRALEWEAQEAERIIAKLTMDGG